MTKEAPTPVGVAERVAVMDVLRGVALFGVFLMNFAGFAAAHLMATEEQLLSLPTAAWDLTLFDVLRWLAEDKANTTFAFLFGLGFYLQMTRLEARGADFERVYRRRLFVLLAIGVIHLVFVWTWDILHLYALAGFVLLAFRRVNNRDLLAGGIICALVGRVAFKVISEFGFVGGEAAETYTNAAALARQHLSESGDYFAVVGNFLEWVAIDYLATGMLIGWLFYALGRFFIGAWVGRHQWISRAREFLPGWRKVARWSLPAGLVLEGAAVLLAESPLLDDFAHRGFYADAMHLFAVPVLATGYIATAVVLFHTRLGGRLLAPFAYAGRMALTNYLMQSFMIGFVLFGIGPGLALAGKIGACAILGIVVACYAAQVLFSRWWLGRFRYGPMEWVWRALTYGTIPSLRLTRAGVKS